LLIAVTVVFVVACMVSDVRTRTIPNVFSATAMVAGITLNWLTKGPAGALSSVGGLAILMAILLPPFALGGIGAGDVKMMGAVGALLGPPLGLASLLTGMLLGGVVTGIHLARRARLREKLIATAMMVGAAVRQQSVTPLRLSDAAPDAITLPYGVPLGLGTLLTVAVSTALGT
jgi:prepilin peptidase CpaA